MNLTIILTFCAFMISLLGTRLLIMALRQRTLMLDIPNLRSNHSKPTPKGGGVAVVFAMLIPMLTADLNYVLLLSVFLLMAISLLDDLIGVPPLVRLLVHVLAVSVPLSMVTAPLFGGLFPLWLDKLIVGALWVWFINLFNFMDGIDGISASEMIAIGLGLAIISILSGTFPTTLTTYGLIVTAAAWGFFWWNRHPARIFLGDVGSVPIGFLLGYLLLIAAYSGYGHAALILPAYYLADSTVTLLRRLAAGKKIWQAHSEHYYQRAVRSGKRHDTVVHTIFGMNILLIFLAVQSTLEPSLAWFELLLAYLSVGLLLGFFSQPPKNTRPS